METQHQDSFTMCFSILRVLCKLFGNLLLVWFYRNGVRVVFRRSVNHEYVLICCCMLNMLRDGDVLPLCCQRLCITRIVVPVFVSRCLAEMGASVCVCVSACV